jgi:hypothetical protein
MANQIGDSKPIVGGYSTQFNGAGGDGAHNPLTMKGSENPGGTKPMKPANKPVPLNAQSGKK